MKTNFLGKILIALLYLLVNEGKSQSGGQGVFSVLESPLHARTMAWGGYLLALQQTDIQYTTNNPALLNHTLHNQYGATYGTLMPTVGETKGVLQGGAGYSYSQGLNNYSLHAQYIDYGTMEGYDAGKNPIGEFSANDLKFTMGYSREFFPREKGAKWVVGAQLGFVYSVLGPYVSNGVFTNYGIHYSPSDSSIQVGLAIKNVGAQLATYKNGEREDLPFNIELGASYKPFHMPFRFHLTAHSLQKWDLTYNQYLNSGQVDLSGKELPQSEANFAEKAARHLAFGGELVMGRNLSVLIGYNHQRRMELISENRRGATGFGFGIRFKVWKYHLTYASASLFPGINTNTLSLSLMPGLNRR